MRILIISNFYPPDWMGGYELGCAQMAGALARLGNDVLVLTTSKNFLVSDASSSDVSGIYSEDKVTLSRSLILSDVYRANQYFKEIPFSNQITSRAFNRHNMMVLASTIKEFIPDVIYCFNTLGLGIMGLWSTARFLNIPLVNHLMDKIPNQAYELPQLKPIVPQNFTRGKTRIPAVAIACSKALLNEILQDDLEFQSTHVVPNWIDESIGNYSVRCYRPGNLLNICFAGSIREEKGIQYIIQGLSELSAEERSRVRVDIFGQGASGIFLQMAREVGVEENVSFKGSLNRRELISRYCHYHLFLFPTWAREPFAFAPMEAASQGCVQAFSDDCGNAEWFQDQVNSLQFKRSSKGVSNLLQYILSGGVDLDSIRKGQDLALAAKFALPVVSRSIETILQEAAKTRPNSGRGVEWVEQFAIFSERVTLKYGIA